ncbi:hypothetical protein ACA910_005962 [Epithemia clementina (nom. ined.)]
MVTELGVGKGLYMAVLPTLLWYSLAAITTASTSHNHRPQTNSVIMMEGVDSIESKAKETNTSKKNNAVDDDDVAMDIGLALLEGTYLASQHHPPSHQNYEAPPLCRAVQVEQALFWLDRLLQLTMAVASTPTGTASLMESGMVPALLSLVALDTHIVAVKAKTSVVQVFCQKGEEDRLLCGRTRRRRGCPA